MWKFLDKKIYRPFLEILKQGLSPQKLALSVTFGLACGLFPVFGTTTALCFICAYLFKLNHPAIQLVNYLLTPVQLLMIIPFIKTGESIFSQNHSNITIEQIVNIYNQSFLLALKVLGLLYLKGILAWLIVAVPVSLVCYFIFFAIFKKLKITDK